MLSSRAKNYKLKLRIDPNWSTNESETLNYLNNSNFKGNQNLIHFQSQYSGILLSIKNKSEDFSAILFSRSQVINKQEIDFEEIDGEKLIECGQHQTAQFRFYIMQNGEICTIDNSDKLNRIYSSFDKKIEQYAFLNEISEWKEIPFFYEVNNQTGLENYLENKFEIIQESSDKYTSFIKNEKIVIVNGKWLDRQSKYFKIYGNNVKECEQIIEFLKNEKIIN